MVCSATLVIDFTQSYSYFCMRFPTSRAGSDGILEGSKLKKLQLLIKFSRSLRSSRERTTFPHLQLDKKLICSTELASDISNLIFIFSGI